jgi:hypothetical protein
VKANDTLPSGESMTWSNAKGDESSTLEKRTGFLMRTHLLFVFALLNTGRMSCL